MDWSTFFTYMLQALLGVMLIIVVLFVGSAAIAGVIDAIRKSRRR